MTNHSFLASPPKILIFLNFLFLRIFTLVLSDIAKSIIWQVTFYLTWTTGQVCCVQCRGQSVYENTKRVFSAFQAMFFCSNANEQLLQHHRISLYSLPELTFKHSCTMWLTDFFAPLPSYILDHQTVFFHLPSSHWFAVPDIGLQSRQAFCSHFLNYTVPRGLVCRTSLPSRPCNCFPF